MIFVLLVAFVSAATTWFVGWWSVAVVALLAGFLYSDDPSTPWRSALGAALAWLALLASDAAMGPFARVLAMVSGAVSLPMSVVLLVTLAFAALLAWSASTIAVEAGRMTGR